MRQIVCLEKNRQNLIFFVKKLRFCLEDTVSRLKAILSASRTFCANQLSNNGYTYRKKHCLTIDCKFMPKAIK